MLLAMIGLVATSCGYSTPDTTPARLPAGVLPVRLQHTKRGYQLLRGGKPYFLRGGAGIQQFGQLHQAGGNTVRTWTTDYAGPLLDSAQHHGLTVMLGIWLEPEGSYFSYYDPAQVKAQLARVRQQVLRYRYHPALLMWNISNELELTTKGVRTYKVLNAIAHMIHELDPYHPITISQANFVSEAHNVRTLIPEIDILSINAYGSLLDLPPLLKAAGWNGPYIVTEYGNAGTWESDSTNWQIPFEQTSAAKARFMRQRYIRTIQGDSSRCLGGYAFYWGHKFEYTDTWFSLFEATGEKTELVDELHQLWRHEYPANRAPHVTDIWLGEHHAPESLHIVAGHRYDARVEVTDPENDTLTMRWEVVPEIRKDYNAKDLVTKPESVLGCITQVSGHQALMRAPTKPGAYRLCVRVFDGHGSVGTANMPFLVPDPLKATSYLSATSKD
jgi:hypothetical protein